MRLITLVFLSTLLAQPAFCYWQQKVDHKINVELDDENHILRGYQEMTYTNNSPDTLKYIFMHLYPSAYKHDHTAFAKQKVADGDTKFYFSEKNEKGFIDSLSFTTNELPLNYSRYNDNEDIIFLELIRPLYPGASIEINTPFRVVIPKTFSRLGHIGQSYQITQWYPKPAVYDKDGWHMMPYLDQGEFYYEYGDYDVEITLPDNYVVASTGDLQNESEKKFITSKTVIFEPEEISFMSNKVAVIKGDSIFANSQIKSSSKSKTIRFTQMNVHDFAWFADKSFLVKSEEFKLPSHRICTAYSFFTPANLGKYNSSAKALAETAKYLSKEVGEYPYNQISIVDGPLYAGGGMEYPNIAIIGSLPDEATVNIVIVHEAGHNWFQGILGSNERMHPWLDEGVNSFYEAKIGAVLKEKKIPVASSGGNDVVYIVNGHIHHDQPIVLPSEDYTPENYGGVVYAKAAKAIALLEDYMGDDDFRQGMQQYFNTWKQKHPSPLNLREALEQNTKQDISWFFNDLLPSKEPIDYIISSVYTKGANKMVVVKDKQGANYPVPVFAMRGDTVLQKNYTIDGEAFFDDFGSGVHYIIDKENVLPEINKRNNVYYPSAFFKRTSPKIGIGTSLLKAGMNKLYLLPAVGFNHYDRTMAGLVIHNLVIPNKQFQFALAPLFSFRANRINGTGVVGYSFYPKNNFYRITASVQGSTFSADSTIRNLSNAIYSRWYKINPRLRFELPKKTLRSPIDRSLVFNYFHTATQGFQFAQDPVDSIYRASISDYEKRNLFRVNYFHRNNRTFNPFGYNVQYETTKDITKVTAVGNIQIDYFMPKKALHIRAFAGKFIYLNNNASFFDVAPYFLNVTPTAVNDYAYENVVLGRNEQTGYKSQQVLDREGGFSSRSTFLANPLGRTDDWLVSINIRSDIPVKFFFLPQLYLNAATFADAGNQNPSGAKSLFEGGLQFNLIKDIIKINVPLVLSKDFKSYNESIFPKKERWYRQISFSLSTDRIDFLRTQERLTKLVF